MELQYPLAHMFPWMEYLVRVGWTPNDDLLVSRNKNNKLNIKNLFCHILNHNTFYIYITLVFNVYILNLEYNILRY